LIQPTFGANLRTRVMTGLIGGPLILAIVYIGGPLFMLAANLTGILGGAELAQMVRHSSRRLLLLVLIVTLTTAASVTFQWYYALPLAVGLFLIVNQWDQGTLLRRNDVYALGGALYIGLAIGLLILLRTGADGMLWTFMLLANNWSTDSFAMIGGRLLGQRKLAPAISPGKTVEGALIGLLAGVIGGSIVALLGGLPILIALIVNITTSLATEGGDLLESRMKRYLRVKDSGTLLPGHGGLLDRIDGTLLAVIWLFLLRWLIG
jgi:phosphatidate cytidylyltransferase